MKVIIDRDDCTMCSVCWSDCPEFFEENPDDQFSQVVEKFRIGGNSAAGEAPDGLKDCVREAADGCPVSIIHVSED